MVEALFAVLVIILLLWVVVSSIVLPIVVFMQGRRIRQLERSSQYGQPPGPVAEPAASAAPPTPVPVEAPAEAPTEAPAEAPLAAIVVAEPDGGSPFTTPAAAVQGKADLKLAATFEQWIGRRGLGWVAVVLLLLATAFFLKHAFDNRWIGELGRVTLGVFGGLGLCVGGLRYHRRGWRVFSQMLTAGGVVLLYLTTFAAFGYYDLLPQDHAAVFMVVLIAETAALAVLYEAPAIAIMALIGALLTPQLLDTGHDRYRALFLYLAAVNAGTVGLAAFRPWPAVGTLSLLGTQLLYWAWYDRYWHPEKLAAALAFQLAVFALYLAYSVLVHVRGRRKASVEDLVRLVLTAALFFTAAYVLLDEDYHVWLGTAAVLMAIVYTALGQVVLRLRPDDGRQLVTCVAVAMGFVAMAIPIQADAIWIALGWAIQGLVLWEFGVRLRSGPLKAMGAVLLCLGVGRLVLVDTIDAHPQVFIPLLNSYALPAAGVAACLLAVAAGAWRRRDRLGLPEQAALWLAGLCGLALIWIILSIETYEYFGVQARQQIAETHGTGSQLVDSSGRALQSVAREEATRLRRWGQAALSVVWAVYATAILALGFRLRTGAIRYAALALYAITLAKVVLVDMAGLPGFYRVATFLVLALTLGLAGWAYQRLQAAQQPNQQRAP